MRITFHAIIALVVLCLSLNAAPTSAQVLDSIDVKAEPDASTIHVNFSVPVRYIKHFPSDSGETLVVFLRVLAIGETGKPRIDEKKSVKDVWNGILPLLDVTFKPDSPEGPQVILRFTKTVQYRVKQGRDNRSIDVIVPNPRGAAEKKNFTPSL